MGRTPLVADEDPLRIGDYWLAGRLGEGGQAVVYEAYDSAGRRVALKALRGGGAFGRPLRREVEAAHRVAPFCTAPVLAADLMGDRPHIVSEFVNGPSLHEAIMEHGPLGPEPLHRLAVGIITAVAAIHQAGVVHRDLKPGNVLLGPDGPRVIDFGIARILTDSGTVSHGQVGTLRYMAPEQVEGERAGPPSSPSRMPWSTTGLACRIPIWCILATTASASTSPAVIAHCMRSARAWPNWARAVDRPARSVGHGFCSVKISPWRVSAVRPGVCPQVPTWADGVRPGHSGLSDPRVRRPEPVSRGLLPAAGPGSRGVRRSRRCRSAPRRRRARHARRGGRSR
ncbi:protein kinase-like protein [Nocardiopsis sp. Huas11]|nr:protein kinase-like protein [Nocardiopsis sp. Huas11]